MATWAPAQPRTIKSRVRFGLYDVGNSTDFNWLEAPSSATTAHSIFLAQHDIDVMFILSRLKFKDCSMCACCEKRPKQKAKILNLFNLYSTPLI
jgi:hypothetical protein